jgi:F-type H+-transporting ATPase subunit b
VFLKIDGTLVVQIVNFIVFLAILNVVFMRPVGAAIAKRRAYINGLTSDIETNAADVRALREQAESKRAAARREADETMAKARAGAQTRASEIAAQSGERAAGIVAEAQRQIQAEIAAARTHEEPAIESLAQLLIERALGPGRAA